MIIRDFLKGIEMFQVLGNDLLTTIEDSFFEKTFTQGSKIFSEGEPATHLWIVVEGKVDLRFDLPGRRTSDVTTLSTISESGVFGWSSLVPPHEYKLSAYCASDKSSLIRCSRDTLEKMFEADQKAGYQFLSSLIKVVGNRFQQLHNIAALAPVAQVKATVHMGTCGIAAGAREVMNTLLEEKQKTNRSDITIESAGCIGKCAEEPNITVAIAGQNPVIYRKVNSDKARQIFSSHLVEGKVLNQFLLT